MGYTHYWNETPACTDEVWSTLRLIVRQILDVTHVPIQNDYDDAGTPEVSDTMIRFNGVEDDGHETFYLSRGDGSFNFCKTAHKPYDEVVVAVLIAFAQHYPGFIWTSDGEYTDFKAGGKLYEQATGYTLPPYHFDEED